MHPNRTASVLLVVFGGLLLLGIWIWRSERADARHGNPGAASVPDDPDDGTEDVADAGSHGQPVESPFGRTETEGLMPNVLELRILREDGGHAKGKVYWTTTPRAPLTSSMMAPEHGFPLPEEGVHSLSHAGAASLSIPDGMWTWLRVTAEGSAVLSAYELVPPFSGEREMDLLLTAASRTLHVFLVESDLDTPAADREVSLYTTDMRSVSSPELRARTRSDESGYAVFRGLSPGGFLLCAEGAKPGDPLPYTQRLIMPAKMPITELPCTLVVPEERIEITIQVDVTLGRTGGLPPKLFLKRKEKRVGDLHPMSGYLRPGQQTINMSVPPGFYEVGVLPIGLVNVPREFRRFEVSADTRTRFKMTLIGRKPETEVELVGLSPRDFPVTVYPQPLDDILDDDVRLMFCGPYRWHLPEQKIAVPSYPAYLIATGRRACWISDRMVQLRGHHARVNMVPATTLEIHWHGEHVVRRRGAVVMVVSRLGTVWRRLRPKLEPSAGRMLPTLLGTVVVPRGKVLLECLLEEDGKTVWKRQVEADRPAFTVEVADEQ